MLQKIFFILGLMIFSFSTATAAVYKWVDDKGNVHYSEIRPKDNAAKKLNVDSTPPANNSSYKRPSLKTKDEDKKQNEANKAADSNGTNAKEKQEQCAQARKDIELMESTGRLRVKDAEGNVSYMSEEDKAARIKRNQDRIKLYCK